jgi:hypothetical protein
MGTRGFVGFVADGTEKIAYNRSDSYPEGLGLDVLSWLRGVSDMDSLRSGIADLRVVSDERPTAEDVERLKPWTNLNVGEQSEDDWYCLLRKTQGYPAEMLKAGYIEDAGEFPTDSLFAEWGYIVDADAQTFEVFKGFQREPHDKGRFAARTPQRPSSALGSTYYPVALVASFPLKELPSDDAFMAAVDPDSEDN